MLQQSRESLEKAASRLSTPLRVSIIIPVFNEERTIAELLRKVLAVELPLQKELVVVDDGSRDRTPQLLAELNRDGAFLLCTSPLNQGKGAALRRGVEQASGDILLIQDADLELEPAEYPILLAPIVCGSAKVVYGSRFSGGRNRSWSLSYLANRFLVALVNLLYGTRITDMETCYKVIQRDVLRQIRLTARRFEFEPEITAKLLRTGNRIFEVPISYDPRSAGQGKKIRAKDGIQAVYHLLKWRLVSIQRIRRE